MEPRVNALVANRQLGAARELLEQWAATWPDDVTGGETAGAPDRDVGRAVEAVRLLQRHIAAYPDDVDALGLGVEWLYGLARGRRLDLVHRVLIWASRAVTPPATLKRTAPNDHWCSYGSTSCLSSP